MLSKRQVFKGLAVICVVICVVLFAMSTRTTRAMVSFGYLENQYATTLMPREIMQTRSPAKTVVRIVQPGDNIQVDDLDVHITTAVFRRNFPAFSGFNVFLNGWARENSNMTFKCCFLHSLPSGELEGDVVIEVQSYVYHVYSQWIVDMQNAEFSCTISQKQLSEMGNWNVRYVTYTRESCFKAPPVAMEIIFPKHIEKSVGVCLKISYGSVDPEKAVEWFEYTKLMGVTKAFTYYFDLDDSAMKVFQYYNSTGFLQMLPIHPAKSKDGTDRGFRKPRYEQQAWVDEVMAANDCKHRMSNFDYVIVMDIDEYILPMQQMRTYYDILKETSSKNEKAGTFSFDSHVVMLDWGQSRNSPLHVGQFVERTKGKNYDGYDRNSRWAFIPDRTYFAQNNWAHPRQPYTIVQIPNNLYRLFHYRLCKKTWRGCDDKIRVKDKAMIKYETKLVDNILALPHDRVLPNSTDYVKQLIEWKRAKERLTQ